MSIRSEAERSAYRDNLPRHTPELDKQVGQALLGRQVAVVHQPDVYHLLRAEGLTGRAEKLFLAANPMSQTEMAARSRGRDLVWSLQHRPDLYDQATIMLAGPGPTADHIDLLALMAAGGTLGEEAFALLALQILPSSLSLRVASLALQHSKDPIKLVQSQARVLLKSPAGLWLLLRYTPARRPVDQVLEAAVGRNLGTYVGRAL